jgi:hypothetical protein
MTSLVRMHLIADTVVSALKIRTHVSWSRLGTTDEGVMVLASLFSEQYFFLSMCWAELGFLHDGLCFTCTYVMYIHAYVVFLLHDISFLRMEVSRIQPLVCVGCSNVW